MQAITAEKLQAGQSVAQIARGLIAAGLTEDAVPLLETAYGLVLSGYAGLPCRLQMLDETALPEIGHAEHLLLVIHNDRITGYALRSIAKFGGSHLRRLPLIGGLCASAARSLGAQSARQVVVDLGDGGDILPYPRLAFGSALPQVALLPDPYFIESLGYADLRKTIAATAPPWHDRDNRVFWRGNASGFRLDTPLDPERPWRWHRRLDLCHQARRSRHAAWLDIGIVGLDTIPEPEIRAAIARDDLQRPGVDKLAFLRYRHLVDIDGYSNSWGLFEKLLMGAAILKVASAAGWRQWYYGDLTAFRTHIPINADLTDFDDAIEWTLGHPMEVAAIATRGRALADGLSFERALLEAEAAFFSRLAPTSR